MTISSVSTGRGKLPDWGRIPFRIVKLVRDYGAQISAAAIVIATWPEATAALLWALTAVNGTYLLVLIARTSRNSLAPDEEQLTASTLPSTTPTKEPESGDA